MLLRAWPINCTRTCNHRRSLAHIAGVEINRHIHSRGGVPSPRFQISHFHAFNMIMVVRTASGYGLAIVTRRNVPWDSALGCTSFKPPRGLYTVRYYNLALHGILIICLGIPTCGSALHLSSRSQAPIL